MEYLSVCMCSCEHCNIYILIQSFHPYPLAQTNILEITSVTFTIKCNNIWPPFFHSFSVFFLYSFLFIYIHMCVCVCVFVSVCVCVCVCVCVKQELTPSYAGT